MHRFLPGPGDAVKLVPEPLLKARELRKDRLWNADGDEGPNRFGKAGVRMTERISHGSKVIDRHSPRQGPTVLSLRRLARGML